MQLQSLHFLNWFILFVLVGCTHTPPSSPSPPPPKASQGGTPYVVGGKVYYPLSAVKDYKERGIASWYGADFHGKKTSSGERYNMYAGTAAHRILPFGTKVLVTNLENGKNTIVTINDRGPFAKDRIIDLSYTGAKAIGLVGPGTALVELEVVSASGSELSEWKGSFSTQIGAFKEFNNALTLKGKIIARYPSAHITTYQTHTGEVYHQVRIGKFNTPEAALQVLRELESQGFQGAFIVVE